jgi:hypothetical protein
VIVPRILAVLAASLLVGAVALAMLGPSDMPLGAALFLVNHDLLRAFRSGIEAHFNHWMWDDMVLPLLIRPVWLLPACLGLISAGLSLTLSNNQRRPQRSPRRRF